MKIVFLAKNLSHLRFFQMVASNLENANIAECRIVNTVGYVGYEYEYSLSSPLPRRGLDGSDLQVSGLSNFPLDISVSKYIFADREIRHFNKVFFPGKNNNSQIWPMVKMLDNDIRLLFEEFDPDFIISEFVIGLMDGLFLNHAINSNKCRFVNVRQSKLSKGIIFCLDNVDMPVRFLSGMQGCLSTIESSSERAIRDIEAARLKYEMPFYMIKTRRNLVPDTAKFKLFFERVHYSIKYRSFFELKWSLRWYFKKIRNYVTCRSLGWSSLLHLTGKKYFVFPLHYEPEQSVDIRGFPYSQIEIIEMISKTLPCDVHLVVKEHRGNRGYRPKEDYLRIIALPNVELLSPDENNKKLLDDTMGVITISGRMGWETMVLGKPLMVCGDSFYKDISGICIFKGVHTLVKFLSNPEGYIADERAVIQKACDYEAAVRKGQFVLNSEGFISNDNIVDFIEGFMDFVKN